jgi:hypothetical protein
MASKIKIKKANVGTYTARAKANGNTVPQQTSADLAPGSKASKAVKKKAQFARNAKGFKH